MNSADCPVLDQLQMLVAGLLDTDDEERISQHLDHCAGCQRRLELAAGQAQLLHDVKERLSKPDDGNFPDMATVISRFHADLASVSERTMPEGAGQGGDFSKAAESDFGAASIEQSVPSLIDSIEIVQEIGRGGMGVVYRGYETSLSRDVAVKMLARRLAAYPEARERFTREARSLAALQHPYIVTIHRIIDPSPAAAANYPPSLVMEYVDGESLETRLRRKGPLPLKEVVRTSIQIAAALAAAHDRDIIHRDIKPANILLERATRCVKLTDFGLARAIDDVTLTQSGTLVGTPGYMSPEQAQGERLDHRSDLFSLGSVMHAMLTGRPPFACDTVMDTMRHIINDAAGPIETARRDVPDGLLQLIRTLHAKDPADRIQTAEEVVWSLQEQRAALPTAAENRVAHRPHTESLVPSKLNPPQVTLPVRQPATAQTGFTVLGALLVLLLGYLGLDVTGVLDRPAAPPADPHLTRDDRVQGDLTDDRRNGIVLYVDGEPDGRRYQSLERAVMQASNDAVIELQTNGPIFIPPLHTRNRRLTIRAASGFRPEIVLDRMVSEQTPENDAPALLSSNGELRLEGLSLTVDDRRKTTGPPPVPAVVACQNGTVRMANCRLVLQSGEACLNIDSTADCRLENCELFSPAGSGIAWNPGTNAQLTVRNTLLTGLFAITVQHQTTDTGHPELRLEQSTLSTIHAVRFSVASGDPAMTQLSQPVAITTDGSVLDVHDSVLHFHVPADWKPPPALFQPWEVPENIRRAIAWRDRSTLFGQPQNYMSWHPASEKPDWPRWQPKQLFTWMRFWGLNQNPQPISEPIQYVSSRQTQIDFPPPAGVADRFQIENRISDDEVELKPGINPLIVGPGPAFDRWRQTPAWQEWVTASDR